MKKERRRVWNNSGSLSVTLPPQLARVVGIDEGVTVEYTLKPEGLYLEAVKDEPASP